MRSIATFQTLPTLHLLLRVLTFINVTWWQSETVDRNRNDRALLIRRLEKHLGDSLIVLRVNGCASIICFRKHLPETLKLVEANDNDEVTELAKKITAEVKENSPKSVKTCNLGDFKLENVKESTNESLLYLILKLVSKGAVTKKSLSLSSQQFEIHII